MDFVRREQQNRQSQLSLIPLGFSYCRWKNLAKLEIFLTSGYLLDQFSQIFDAIQNKTAVKGDGRPKIAPSKDVRSDVYNVWPLSAKHLQTIWLIYKISFVTSVNSF